MKKLIFEVSGYVELMVEDSVIERAKDLADEFNQDERLFNNIKYEDLLGNLAYNMVQNLADLSQLDGWADLDDKDSKLHRADLDYNLKEIESEVSK